MRILIHVLLAFLAGFLVYGFISVGTDPETTNDAITNLFAIWAFLALCVECLNVVQERKARSERKRRRGQSYG